MCPSKACWENGGKSQVGVKWVEPNKSDKENLEYRCRLVAKEIKTDMREDLLALEAHEMLLALWATVPGMSLDFIDVVLTYFHAKARRRV